MLWQTRGFLFCLSSRIVYYGVLNLSIAHSAGSSPVRAYPTTMRHIKLLTTDSLTLEYNAVEDYIVATWHGAFTRDVIKQGYEQILFFMQKEHCHKLLDNHYDVQGLWVEVTDWLAYDWHPRAEKAGLQYHAAVYSQDYFSRLSTDRAINMVRQGIAKGFETTENAEGWLNSL